jgi:hypothetical protein
VNSRADETAVALVCSLAAGDRARPGAGEGEREGSGCRIADSGQGERWRGSTRG